MDTITKTRDVADKKGRIVNAIVNYQKRHPGWSPSDDLLSRETQLPVHEVKHLITVLEREGVVGIVGKWPRQLWVTKPEEAIPDAEEVSTKPSGTLADVAPAGLKDAVAANPTKRGPYRRKTAKLPFFVRAKEAARIIDDMRSKGEKTYINEISKRLYGHNSTGQCSVLINKMTKEGWLSHRFRHHADIAVTAKGRFALFGQDVELLDAAELPPKWEPELEQKQVEDLRQEVEPKIAETVSIEAFSNTRVELHKALNKVAELEAQLARSVKMPLEASEELLQRIDNIVANNKSLSSFSDGDLLLELVNRGYNVSKR